MSVQERLKVKRETCDTWSTREQLCLASSVLKSGDQNWISVSRSMKPFAEKEALRPPDWFSQKSCAIQYAILLENAEAPKRKKRESIETTGESIVKRLTQERIAELGQILAFQRDEYQQLKAEVDLLKLGSVSDEKMQKMWQAIEQEEREQEQKLKAHSLWLAKRQQKLEISSQLVTSEAGNSEQQPEPMETSTDMEDDKKNKPAVQQSTLLTSLLKSSNAAAQLQNTVSTGQIATPTISSLLNSLQASQSLTPQITQIVSSVMAPVTTERPSAGAPTLSMLLALPANLSRGTLPSIPAENTRKKPPDTIAETNPEIPDADPIDGIIDQIDNVIGKEKIEINKDEMNEIIEDIVELIQEEITRSPQTDVAPSTAMEEVPVPLEATIVEPKNIDEPESQSSESEITLEEIDQSTTNIAKIIGATIEPPEPDPPKEEVTVPEKIKDPVPANEDEKVDETPMDVEETLLEIVNKIEDAPEPKDSKVVEATLDVEKADETRLIPERTQLLAIKEKGEEQSKVADEPEEPAEAENASVVLEEPEVIEEKPKDEERPEIAEEKPEEPVETAREMETEGEEKEPEPEPVRTEEKEEIPPSEAGDEKVEDSPVSEKPAGTQKPVEDAEPLNNLGETEEKAENNANIEDSVPQNKRTEESIDEEPTLETNEAEEEPEKPEAVVEDEEIDEEPDEQATDEAVEAEREPEKVVEPEEAEEPTPESTNSLVETVDEAPKAVVSEVPKAPEAIVKEEVPEPSTTESTEKPEKSEEEKVEEKPSTSQVSVVKKEEELEVKKEEVSLAEDMDMEEEESSLTKLSGGRAMKTYSKRQSIAVDSEPETESSGEGAEYRAWKKAVLLVYNRLATHKYASIFLRPITEDQAPGYHSVVSRPMDLSTIKKNIDNGTIRSTMHFQRDVMLMFQNAIMYNKRDTFVYKMAVCMEEECLQHMHVLVEVIGESSFRRETRTGVNDSSESGFGKRKRSLVIPSPHETESSRFKKRRKSEND